MSDALTLSFCISFFSSRNFQHHLSHISIFLDLSKGCWEGHQPPSPPFPHIYHYYAVHPVWYVRGYITPGITGTHSGPKHMLDYISHLYTTPTIHKSVLCRDQQWSLVFIWPKCGLFSSMSPISYWQGNTWPCSQLCNTQGSQYDFHHTGICIGKWPVSSPRIVRQAQGLSPKCMGIWTFCSFSRAKMRSSKAHAGSLSVKQ